MIAVRASTRCSAMDRLSFFIPPIIRILAYVRRLGNETVLVVNNLSSAAQAVELDLGRYMGNILIEMFGKNIFRGWATALSVNPGALPVLLVSVAANLSDLGSWKRCHMRPPHCRHFARR